MEKKEKYSEVILIFVNFFYGNYKYDDFVREHIIDGMVTKKL